MKFQMLGGDFSKKAYVHRNPFDKTLHLVTDDKRINLKGRIESLQIITEENKKKIAGSIGWGFVGGLVVGPIGALAGILAGGRKTEVCFVCTFKDGRRFVAIADAKLYRLLVAEHLSADAQDPRIRSEHTANRKEPTDDEIAEAAAEKADVARMIAETELESKVPPVPVAEASAIELHEQQEFERRPMSDEADERLTPEARERIRAAVDKFTKSEKGMIQEAIPERKRVDANLSVKEKVKGVFALALITLGCVVVYGILTADNGGWGSGNSKAPDANGNYRFLTARVPLYVLNGETTYDDTSKMVVGDQAKDDIPMLQQYLTTERQPEEWLENDGSYGHKLWYRIQSGDQQFNGKLCSVNYEKGLVTQIHCE